MTVRLETDIKVKQHRVSHVLDGWPKIALFWEFLYFARLWLQKLEVLLADPMIDSSDSKISKLSYKVYLSYKLYQSGPQWGMAYTFPLLR